MNRSPSSPVMEIVLQGQNLSRSFGGVNAVNGMDMALRRGTITGLVGPNGAGKSTLCHLLSGVVQPNSGRVELFGVDVTQLATHERAHRGMVRSFQLAREFGAMTVLENLMLAPQGQSGETLSALFFKPREVLRQERQIYDRACEVLQLSKLAALRNEYAGNLSGGQKKLLELGRCLMTDCPVILLDEPGAGVNPALMGLLTEMIRALNRDHGKTFLIVEHDMDFIARLCDPVIVMAEGRLLVEGSFGQVKRDPRVIEAYLGGEAKHAL